MKINDGARGVRQELGRPIRTDHRALLPGQRWPAREALPTRFSVPNEAIGTLVENVIGHGHFAGHVGAIGEVVTKDQYPIGMSDVDQAARQLAGAVITAGIKVRAAAHLDNEKPDALALVVKHQTVL